MKTLRTFLTLFISLLVSTAFATIINVNNDTPSPGEYTDLQLAVDDAAPGDTIYLAPTLVNYGSISMNKKLNIIGPGFVVSADILGAHAVVEDISLTDSLASGSKFIGFRFNELALAGPGTTEFTDLGVLRCNIDERVYAGNDRYINALFEGNVFTFDSYNLYGTLGDAFTQCTVSNNIFNGWVYYTDFCELSNNIFLGISLGTVPLLTGVDNSSVINNITIGRNVSSAGASNFYGGNLSYDGSNNTFPNGTNLENVDPEFVSYGGGLFDLTHDYTLGGTSPAIGSGAGGDDIGVYGGTGVYRKDGEPSIPIIRTVNVPGGTTVPANSTFTVNIISEAHE